MKRLTLLLLPALLTVAACEVESPPLDMERFNVLWNDYDGSGTPTVFDDLTFEIRVATTDPDPDDQFITEWEFSYTVNNTFGGILDGDEGLNAQSVSLDANIVIELLDKPGPGVLEPGDRIDFTFWAIDNRATVVERTHTFLLEP